MSGWGMNATPLYSSGGQIGGLGTDADAAGRGLLTAISDAEDTVHHATVVAALGRYHTTVSKPANQLGEDVRALGSQVQTTATTGADSDVEAHYGMTGCRHVGDRRRPAAEPAGQRRMTR